MRLRDRSPADYPRIALAVECVFLSICLVFGSAPTYAKVSSGLPAPPLVPKRESHVVHKQIEALEMQWRQAQVDNNIAVMDHLLADDYVGITANGTIETKSQAIALRKAGTIRITQLDLDDLKVRLYGDTAVVTSKADLQGVNGQSDISGVYRYTRVYNRRLGQWKIVSFEASRIHDADARPGKHQ
jgi:ketosteroid isomerase-like protein